MVGLIGAHRFVDDIMTRLCQPQGPFRLAVRAGSHMAESHGGSIINAGTIGSLLASPNELPTPAPRPDSMR